MDWKKLGPLALAALVMTLLPFRLTPAGSEQARSSSPPSAGASAASTIDAPAEVSHPPEATLSRAAVDLLSEYSGHLAGAFVGSQQPSLPLGARLEFLIATVPDPLDTTLALDFDFAVDGIQRGFAAEGFLLDRFSLPWHDAQATVTRAYRQEPGVMLYRRVENGESQLQLVLLVGETPRQGLHAAAFDRAVATVRAFQPASANPVSPATALAILGPYFSGSVESLARALVRNQERGARVVTGAATGSDLAEPFDRLATEATFERAVPEDSLLLGKTLCALEQRLKLPPHSVALLVEADTAYGASLASTRLPCALEPLVVRFSGRLSSLRAAFGRKVKGRLNESVELSTRPDTELELDLVSPGRAVDVVSELSPDASDLDDLALANLIRNLAAEGYRFVGLLSTDPMDKLYLGKRLHQLAPDLLLFTFNNSLLYAHPQAGAALDGTLVITSAPLVPEIPGRLERQQLATETQSGLLRATRALVGDPAQRAERLAEGRRFGWIVAVGGGSLWPIITVPLEAPAGAARPGPTGVKLTGQVVLVLGALVALLGFGAGWLHRTAPPRDSLHPAERRAIGGESAWHGRWLLAGGLSLLAFTAWIAVVLAALSFPRLAAGGARLNLVLFALAAAFTVSIAGGLRIAAWLRGREPHPRAPRALPGGEKQWIPLGLVLLALAGRLLIHGWTGDQVHYQFFYQRALTLTSGLSPLVALAFLGLALFGWFLLQLKRLRASARHGMRFPRPALATGHEDLAAAAELADQELAPLLTGVFPATSNRRFWGALFGLVLLLIVAAVPGGAVRPLTETVGYGWYFGGLVLVLLILGSLSWYRFLRLWRALQRTLTRVPPELLRGLEQPEVAGAIAWNPMRSFAWSMPKFRMVKIAADEVEGHLSAGDLRDEVRDARQAMLAAEADHNLEAEVAARHRLVTVFEHLDQDPLARTWTGYHAFRFAAYLRYVFEILRNQLLTTVWLGLMALGAVSFYDYHPRYLLTLAVAAALVGLAGTVLITFYQMETNPTLSAVAGVQPTEVKSWGQLIVNLLSYVLMPLLALLASRIPFLGDLLRQLGNPLLQSVGGS